jgi:SHS2 domain-containing protein
LIINSTALDYQIIDHTADLGIIVKGPDIKSLFILAAQAMTDIMVKGDIRDRKVIRDVLVEGEDFPDLMVRWLGEILYLFEGENLILNSIEIKSISPVQLKSTLTLTSFEPKYHKVLREIKAVTYHQISVDKTNDGWEARIIFDI